MLTASAPYLAQEALLTGATPAVRATFLSHFWPDGLNDDGTFTHCIYLSPTRIQADFAGFAGGVWISEVLTANLQIPTSPSVPTWTQNNPGYDLLFFWRGAATTALLSAASWVQVNPGDTLQITPYYQFKVTIEGYRAWAEESLANAGTFTAYAEDTPGADAYQGYAADALPGDNLTYLEALVLLGEFSIMSDIEQAGTVSLEAPKAFDDLVAGTHSGLLLNNRQKALDGSPAPLYSPDKSSFLFAGETDWYGKQLRVDLGWKLGATVTLNTAGTGYAPNQILTVIQSGASGMKLIVRSITGGGATGPVGTVAIVDQGVGHSVATALVTTVNTGGGSGFKANITAVDVYTEFITLFLGKVTKWGPVTRALGSPHNVEIYAKDYLADCLQKRICLPAADGTPAPLTFGEFLCKSTAVSGWSPAPIIRSAYFVANNYDEFDSTVVSGGGALSLVTPGIVGARAFQAAVTGASQAAYGILQVPTNSEIFITGTVIFKAFPGTPANLNMYFINIDGDGGEFVSIDNTGAIYAQHGGQSKFNIEAYQDVPLQFAVWFLPTANGYLKVWINGDEVVTSKGNFTGANPFAIYLGAKTGGTAENWTIQFENIDLRYKYYADAYKVDGAPFTDIGSVYIDNRAQPDSQTVGSFTQTVTRFPQYGIVQFASTDTEFKVSGEVMMRVVEYAGGRHALYVVEQLLAAAGVTPYIDAPTLAAAYAAVPDDIINARFEGGSSEKKGYLQDFASLGTPIADALKEICSRMLYWIFMDAGVIKVIPYTGTPPSSPVLSLTGANTREADQIIDMDQLNAFVSGTYGWYARNPSLFYVAGDQTAGGQGTGLDFTWDGPVCCELQPVVKYKVDLLLGFLSAQDRVDPVKINLAGARLELMDPVSLTDVLLNDAAQNYWITRKEIGLDPGSREASLQLMRFLGES